MIKKIFKNYGHYIYLYIFSCFALFLCSGFSPIYQYNFSVDPSAYLTVGKGIMHGLIPYKDLFDIKGPSVFFLYAIFSTFKIGTNYFGIYILEVISLCISITFIYKIILLISQSKKWSLALTLIYPFILLNKDSFISGGEVEEFILPLVFILIYSSLKIIKNNFITTKIEYFIQGLLLGFAFWAKYTTIGAWIAFYISLSIIFILKKNYQELQKMIYFSFLGFIIPTFFICLYFIMNHAFKDLLWGYFGWNYIYGGSTHAGFLNQLLYVFFHTFTIFMKRNIIIWLLVIVGPYFAILKSNFIKQKSAKIMLISMTFSSIGLELIGGIMYPYYQLMSIPFSVLTFSWIANNLKNIKINKLILILGISIAVIAGILIVNPNIKDSKIYKHKSYQERFAKIIRKKSENPTLLDFNELDQGWYNYLNITPPTKYFYKMNVHHDSEYSSVINEQLNIIKHQKVDYIICTVSDKDSKEKKFNQFVFKYYQIIDQHKLDNDKKVLLLKKR